MAKKSFWENVGRGVGEGWKKAQEITSRLSDQAEGKLDLREVKKELDRAHVRLGELVAAQAIDAKAGALDLDTDDIAEQLTAIREARERIAALEAEAEKPPQEEQERDESKPA